MIEIAIDEAIAHLGAALMQTVPSDDQIIIGHIRSAHTALTIARRAQRTAPPANQNTSLDDVDRANAAVAAEIGASA